jgi:hypothetical protein
MKKWQLKRLSTDEALNEPQDLPPTWKNITGLTSLAIRGETARLNNLSWAGHNDLGWFEIEEPEPVFDQKKFVDDQIAYQLQITLPMVAADNTNITKAQRQAWLQYRRELQEIQYQEEYPETIRWPIRPE